MPDAGAQPNVPNDVPAAGAGPKGSLKPVDQFHKVEGPQPSGNEALHSKEEAAESAKKEAEVTFLTCVCGEYNVLPICTPTLDCNIKR